MGMTVYKDLVTGDEIISSSYDLIDKDDVVYEVDCQMITVGGETFDTGANASAEEVEEGVEDAKVQVNNVVSSFRLQDMTEAYGGDLKEKTKAYTSQFKGYLKKVVAALKAQGKSDEEIKTFQTGVSNYFAKVIKPNLKDYDFYTGESTDPDGMLLLLNYREDGVTPYFTIWKHALKAERF